MSNASDTSVLRGRTPFTHHVIPITGGDFVVPVTLAEFFVLEFTGDIGTSAFNLKLPPVDGHSWLIYNHTSNTGAMTAITSAPGSVGVVIPQGTAVPCWTNGVDIFAYSSASLAGAGTLSGTELVTLGTFPAPTEGVGNGSSVVEITVGNSSSVTLDATVGTYGPIVRFLGANQDFTAVFPIAGPYNHWLVWNDSDYLATTTCPVSAGGANTTHTIAIPPRTEMHLAVVNESSGDARIMQNFSTTAAFAGAASVVIPDANTYTFSIAEEAQNYLKLTSGTKTANVFFRNTGINKGRAWMIWNATAFLMTIKSSTETGLGVSLPAGAAALITVGDDGNARRIGPTSAPSYGFVSPDGLTSIAFAGNSASIAWTDLLYPLVEITGGSATSEVLATWPAAGTGLFQGMSWMILNNTGQVLRCLASGGTIPVFLQNGDRKVICYEGPDLKAAVAGTLQGQSGYGTNQDGSDLVIAPGQCTGFGTAGALRFKAGNTGGSGSALQSLYDKLVILDSTGTFLALHSGTSDVFRMQTVEAATSGATLKSLPGIDFQGQYWNGSVSTAVHAVMDLNVSATTPRYRWRVTTANSPRLQIGEAGQVILSGTSQPADAELLHSELSIALDDTIGATKILFKAKDAAGTVRTASISLT